MSGEAGASLQSTYYVIHYLSGMMVSVAEPPQIEGEEYHDYTAEYFESENKQYEIVLKQLKANLDELFDELVQTGSLFLLPLDLNAHYSRATIIEDVPTQETDASAEMQLKDWLNGQEDPKLLLSFDFYTKNHKRIEIQLTVSQRILRTRINELQEKISDIFQSQMKKD
jgi:hypothetical protein